MPIDPHSTGSVQQKDLAAYSPPGGGGGGGAAASQQVNGNGVSVPPGGSSSLTWDYLPVGPPYNADLIEITGNGSKAFPVLKKAGFYIVTICVRPTPATTMTVGTNFDVFMQMGSGPSLNHSSCAVTAADVRPYVTITGGFYFTAEDDYIQVSVSNNDTVARPFLISDGSVLQVG